MSRPNTHGASVSAASSSASAVAGPGVGERLALSSSSASTSSTSSSSSLSFCVAGSRAEFFDEPHQLCASTSSACVSSGDVGVCVADSRSHRIQIYSLRGQLLKTIGNGHGSADGCMISPRGVAVTSSEVFVSDYGGHRIEVFDFQGKFLRKWGKFGKSANEFAFPGHILLHSDLLYILDCGNYRVQICDLKGNFLGTFGSYGSAEGQLKFPFGLAILKDRIYVSDSLTNFVNVYSLRGAFIQRFRCDDSPRGLLTKDGQTGNAATQLLVCTARSTLNFYSADGEMLRRLAVSDLPNSICLIPQSDVALMSMGSDRCAVHGIASVSISSTVDATKQALALLASTGKSSQTLSVRRLGIYSIDCIAAHDRSGDMWVAIHGRVYDVSEFIRIHPGGGSVLKENAGRDCSEGFEEVAHSAEARQQMQEYAIGVLENFFK